ncbi:hypothetical protein HUS23_08295 [Ectothiorhodospiraceae bacterium 2226]|nr:hypothetical protein HUS23_08295 [Ectothiorhodospiraceae bacterium 2226]
MHPRNRMFILAALVYSLLGGLLGLTWVADPLLIPGNVPRIHGHVMLLGFIMMMIYGVGLHVLPRFSGRPLYSERLANIQLYAANLGLWLMVAGWMLWHNPTVIVGGVLVWGAMGLFAANIALTVRHYGPKGA